MSHRRRFIAILGILVFGLLGLTRLANVVKAAPDDAAYIALGDSIEAGLGDGDLVGYVHPFGAVLANLLATPVEVVNLGVPFATTRDILRTQLPSALDAIQLHRPHGVVVSWGGGGNDLTRVALSEQAAVCQQLPSCLGRFNALLNEVEQTIDHTIAALRLAAGPESTILMRTQYNALRKSGCAPNQAALDLGDAVLEGAPGTVLDQGLNDRIQTIAERYDAKVVDLFFPFAFAPDLLVSNDCIHPSSSGYDLILALFQTAFLTP
jgi:lysophospholipase L1-like esterase